MRRFYTELWNRWQLELAEELLADGLRFRGSMGTVCEGREEFKDYVEAVRGAFPDWLAPEQFVVLPVTDAQAAAAASVGRHATRLGLRARVAGPDSGTLNRRIRSSRLVPYQAVIGERDVTNPRFPQSPQELSQFLKDEVRLQE